MLSVTIGIPYFNRRLLIDRAIKSIDIANENGRIEIIIFDDGSDDPLLANEFVQYATDIKVIRSAVNKGVCHGRNVLLSSAETDLFMILDSDDTVPEDFLHNIDAAFLNNHVDGVLFRCLWDDGTISPALPLPQGRIDLAKLLSVIQSNPTRRMEWRSVVRVSTRSAVTWGEGHRKMEKYHYDLVSHYQIFGSNLIIRNYHSDASDQISKSGLHGDKSSSVERDRVLGTIEVLDEYGVEMKKIAPKRYIHQLGFMYYHAAILKKKDVAAFGSLADAHSEWLGFRFRMISPLVVFINTIRRATRQRVAWPL